MHRPRNRVHDHVPAVFVHDAVHDRQPPGVPLFHPTFGQSSEISLQHIGRYARPGVGSGELHEFADNALPNTKSKRRPCDNGVHSDIDIATPFNASRALMQRLSSTCSIWTLSASTLRHFIHRHLKLQPGTTWPSNEVGNTAECWKGPWQLRSPRRPRAKLGSWIRSTRAARTPVPDRDNVSA